MDYFILTTIISISLGASVGLFLYWLTSFSTPKYTEQRRRELGLLHAHFKRRRTRAETTKSFLAALITALVIKISVDSLYEGINNMFPLYSNIIKGILAFVLFITLVAYYRVKD